MNSEVLVLRASWNQEGGMVKKNKKWRSGLLLSIDQTEILPLCFLTVVWGTSEDGHHLAYQHILGFLPAWTFLVAILVSLC